MSETIVLAIILNIVYNEVRALAQANGVPTATGYLVLLVKKRISRAIYNFKVRRKNANY